LAVELILEAGTLAPRRRGGLASRWRGVPPGSGGLASRWGGVAVAITIASWCLRRRRAPGCGPPVVAPTAVDLTPVAVDLAPWGVAAVAGRGRRGGRAAFARTSSATTTATAASAPAARAPAGRGRRGGTGRRRLVVEVLVFVLELVVEVLFFLVFEVLFILEVVVRFLFVGLGLVELVVEVLVVLPLALFELLVLRHCER
jgi:hypothetical protein